MSYFKAKTHQIRFGPTGGPHSAPPDPLAGFKASRREREGKGEGREKGGGAGEREKERERKEGNVASPL